MACICQNPRHARQNSIARSDYIEFWLYICEGTEQIHLSITTIQEKRRYGKSFTDSLSESAYKETEFFKEIFTEYDKEKEHVKGDER